MDRRDFLGKAGLSGCALLSLESFCPAERNADRGRTIDVTSFGAKGDGKASDTEAIQRALNEAGNYGGAIYFPAGVYCCHDLKVPANVMLKGEPVWHYKREAVGAVLQLDDPRAECLLNITDAFGVHIYGLVLNGLGRQDRQIHGIFLNNPKEWSAKEDSIVIDDIKVMNFSGHGVYLNRIWLFIIRHSHFIGNFCDGVRIKGWDGFVTDNQFSGNWGNGFGCEEVGATVMFTANRVEWNHEYGLRLCNGDDWNITGNSFDRNYGAGLFAENMKAVTITGNVFRRCGKDSALLSEGEKSCQVRLDGCNGLCMSGNTCLAGKDDGGKGLFTPQVGFIISKLSYCVISSNTLWQGYMQDMIVDFGGHGPELIIKDNVGCPKTV
ncbi:MAG: right-handed parallel beta-helix repeat-containing protein [Bacteroidales bacterium]|nr:right-handed parallel beta-helix repeat-containing protein [Candidatus Cacconaster merdequi]